MQKVESKLHLLIQTPLSTKEVVVTSTTRVGALIASLVEQEGLPLTDLLLTPLHYRLCPLLGRGELPQEKSFGELAIPSGSTLRLEVAEASCGTMPVEAQNGILVEKDYRTAPLSFDGTVDRPAGRRTRARLWSRRAVVVAGAYTAISCTGLAAGAATALLQHMPSVTKTSGNRRPKAAMTFNGPGRASKQLTFTRHHQQVRTVSWSPDGRLLASGSDDARVLIWGLDGQVQMQLRHPAAVRAVAWAADGQRLAAGAANEVIFWQALTGTMLARFPHSHTAAVTSLAWSAREPSFVVTGSMDKSALVWSTNDADYHVQTTFTLHTAAITAVSWASDGQTVASASLGGLARIWDARSGQELHGFFQPANAPERTVQFAPVGLQLALGSDDGKVYLWNDGKQCMQQNATVFGQQCVTTPQSLQAHVPAAVKTVAWSPSGRLLASGGDDKMVRIWMPAQSQSPLLTIPQPDEVEALAWGATDAQLAVASGRTVILWAVT